MSIEEEYRCLVEAYYGIIEMDEYDLKVYTLKEIEKYIIDFVNQNKLDNFNYKYEADNIKDNISTKTKLQSSLIVLNKINAPIEIILLVKNRLKYIN